MPNQISTSTNGQATSQDQLRSSEVDEVLSQPPSWLIQWGITVVFLVVGTLVAVGWFIHYPDIVTGHLRIVGDNYPKSVSSKTDGKLLKLLVKDEQLVAQGQHLAYMESTANIEEVLSLAKVLDSLLVNTSLQNLSKLYGIFMPFYFQLGELQKSFQTFQEQYIRAKALLKGSTFDQKQAALQNDLQQLALLESNLNTQIINYQNDLNLAEADLQMNQKLHKEKVVADVEVRRSQSVFISKKQIFDQAQTAFNNNGMAQNQKKQELIELTKVRTELQNSLFQALTTLKSDIEAWKQRYVLSAPVQGKVSFITPIQEGTTLKNGQELFYIVSQKTGFHGEMIIGQYNFGKVKPRQEVIIKLPSYPFQEFGALKGQVASIAELPRDSTYLIHVSFPKGLITSSHKQIPFRNGMTASGEIITEDVRLIERLFYNFKRGISR
ncbi:HlyD family secretion protein [Runella slithyformis]|uniref:Secretion protein HlyD family protein n=1 Tax=Runella slithyformis (strain ATCC 29530 / DSM 19594 / LMG 11500 / NCIMB 11436 / LSU 4) TaxID=761193 RepID=A0A7U3ZHL3_RUNSL|nr:HlyD family efflux transporter periplasmic adaptor subunit [Runella slithyformis]AEI47372.1 secretion protein HlyD family protein [Runella slithyformis DSM 19594]